MAGWRRSDRAKEGGAQASPSPAAPATIAAKIFLGPSGTIVPTTQQMQLYTSKHGMHTYVTERRGFTD
jgi:hypothetical protein